jgi:sugar/nucleoside kinase (ribokinase family)
VRPGGAALYAAVTAHRLGLAAAILTSHADDFPLEAIPPQIEVVSLSAPETTVFEHDVEHGRRRLRVLAAAGPLTTDDVPDDWHDAAIVLLAPVLSEVDPRLAAVFGAASVGVEAQGWLRSVGADGAVAGYAWRPPAFLLPLVQALFVSAQDVRGQEAQMLEWMQRVPLGVVTSGAAGALLYVNAERYEIRPRPAREEVDATGAGDVFATTFLVHYHRRGDPWEAAEAAACAASLAVEGEGWTTVPDAAALDAALTGYRAGSGLD